ncbi:hypothetical protein ANO11243_084130 [Dothideomycetidae sp. 11243]|nr:hypothetical protein ANO11243_084130 [fungal sp. No.11243]
MGAETVRKVESSLMRPSLTYFSIIRILLMIPVYSTVSFLSYLNYRHSIYYQVLRDCYEAFAIASFFTLLCHYIAPNLHDQKEYFRSVKPVNWFWGVFGLQKCTGGKNKGPLRIPRSGLTWFNVIYVGIFQYCFIRVLFTIVSVVTQAAGRYCDASISPAFAHVWVMVFEASAVSIAMFCLIQFYIQLRVQLAEHKPFLKVLCIKLVIFFSFWQTFVISFLSSSRGPLHPSSKIAYSDIKIGIPSVLLCVEMAIFSVMHVFAFPWKPYTLEHLNSAFKAEPYESDGFNNAPPQRNTEYTYQGGHLGLKALGEAFNPWDIIKASARGFRWLFVGRRTRFQDASYTNNLNSDPNKVTGPITSGPPGAGAEMEPMYSKVSHSDGQTRYHAAGVGNNRESDMDGLLAHPDSPPHQAQTSYPLSSSPSPTPYQQSAHMPSMHQTDNKSSSAYQAYNPHSGSQAMMPTAGAYGGLDDHNHGYGDTSYHGANSSAQQQQQPQQIGVAYGGADDEWDQSHQGRRGPPDYTSGKGY